VQTPHPPFARGYEGRFYAHHAHRVRGERAAPEPSEPEVEERPAKKRRCGASWARLNSKVFHADPLTCAALRSLPIPPVPVRAAEAIAYGFRVTC